MSNPSGLILVAAASAGIAVILLFICCLLAVKYIKRIKEEGRLRRRAAIFERNPAPVFEVDKRGKILYYNGSAGLIFGDSLEGKNIEQLIPSCNAVFFEEGESSIFLYGTDITGRKEIEKQLRTLSIAVEQSANTILITDTEGRITFANKAFERTTGYTVEEAVGEKPSILKSGAQRREVYDGLWSTISSGGVWHGEFLNKRKDGTTYWEEAVITPIKDEKNELIAYLAVKEDITRRKSAEEEMIRAKQEAETANRLKSEFLANMSHEIRTPMNAIIGFTDLLLDGEEDREKQAQLNIIRKSGKNLLNLINDILDFSRIEAGKVSIERSNLNLHRTLNHIKKMYDVAAQEKGLDFYLSIGKEVPERVSGDELRLNQILLNIVSNGFKFTEKGSVRINCSYKRPHLFVSVTDTGIGIPEEKYETIFSAFEQADSTMERQFGGTGLGLAISRRLAALMNGTITLRSEVGKGSTFIVQIEILPAGEAPAGKKTAPGGPPEREARNLRGGYGKEMVARWVDTIEDEDIQRIIRDGISELPKKLEKLKDAVSREKKQDVRFIAHDIKGFSGNLNMSEIFERVRVINEEIERSEPSFSHIRSVLDELEMIVSSIPKEYMLKPETYKWAKEKMKSEFAILLADDNEMNQRLIRMFLKKIGLDCDTAANGREAIGKLEKRNYDLLLLDMQMPIMDGEETIRYVRESIKMKDLYVIALTAHAMKGDARRYIDLGCNDYLSKPLDRRLLYEKVNKLVLQKRYRETGNGPRAEVSAAGGNFTPEEARMINRVLEDLKANANIFDPVKIAGAARELETITEHPVTKKASKGLMEAAENFDEAAAGEVMRELSMLLPEGGGRENID